MTDFTEIDPSVLDHVSGGFDEGQLRSWASENCPRTYSKLANKSMSQITRSDANRCIAEANPDPFTRGYLNSQLDSYFGSRHR